MAKKAERVFFVDDEPLICKAASRTLARRQLEVTCFTNAADCLKALDTADCDLLITDVNMPDMDGVELLERVKRIRPGLPVLIITGYGNIPLAVRAVKAGAFDFVEKPLERVAFLRSVESALMESNQDGYLAGKALSKVEMKVLKLIVDGKSNKEAAHLLNRSTRTIEDHRARIMGKLDVDNIVDLVKRVVKMGG